MAVKGFQAAAARIAAAPHPGALFCQVRRNVRFFVVMKHYEESEFQMHKRNSRFFPVLAIVSLVLASLGSARASFRVSDPAVREELARLAALKNVYDPEHVFRLNPKVAPGPPRCRRR